MLPSKLSAALPVLFLHGEKDKTCPQSHVDRMPEFISNLKIIRFDGKGHWLMAEVPNEVTRHVLDFLSGVFTVKKPRL